MLFTAAFSLFVSLGSSLVVASPIYSVQNTTLLRGCGTTPSQEFVAEAEAHFAKNRVTADPSDAQVAVASIPVYCMLDVFSYSLRCGGADTGLLPRACGLREHFPLWGIHPRLSNRVLHQRHER